MVFRNPREQIACFAKKAITSLFCEKSNYNNKCENITGIAIRKKILQEEKRCLLNGHVIKNCGANYYYFNCQGKNHNRAICDRL